MSASSTTCLITSVGRKIAPNNVLADVFDAVGRHVPNVVLCGNRNRARKYAESHGNPDDPLGKDNYFATLEGMTSLLEGCGYAIVTSIADGDPIVIGAKTISPAN